MDNTIRVTDPLVGKHLADVYAQVKELIRQYPENRRREDAVLGCREWNLFASFDFEQQGRDGQSDISLCIHDDPSLGQELDCEDRGKCSQPYALLDLTRTTITVDGPTRSIEVHRLRIGWTVSWGRLENQNLSMNIRRETITTTRDLPTESDRRSKSAESAVKDVTSMINFKELEEATDEFIAILSAHTPPP